MIVPANLCDSCSPDGALGTDQLAVVLESLPMAVHVVDLEDTIRYVNSAFTNVTGFSAIDVIGQPSSILRGDHHQSGFFDIQRRQLMTGKNWNGLVRLRRVTVCRTANSMSFVNYWARVKVAPLKSPGGQLIGLIASHSDASGELAWRKVSSDRTGSADLRERLQKQFGRSLPFQERLGRALDEFVGHYSSHFYHRWTILTKEAEHHGWIQTSACFGSSVDSCFSSDKTSCSEWMQGFPQTVDTQALCPNDRAAERGKAGIPKHGHVLVPLSCSRTEKKYLLLHSLPNAVFDRSTMRALEDIGILISEAIEKEAASLRESEIQTQLTHAKKLESVGMLAAGIAHEINTPIQYVSDNSVFLEEVFGELAPLLAQASDLARKIGADENVNEQALKLLGDFDVVDVENLFKEIPNALKQSQEGIAQVTKIVASMKEFSRRGTEGMSEIDLNRAISNTINISTSEWSQHAEMVTDFCHTLPLVTCLPDELNQVILNLIVNAADAIREANVARGLDKGTITISTVRDGDTVEVRIKDTGTGVSDQISESIFDPFFSTKDTGSGSGQGLSLARGVIVNKHGGTLEFETVPDVGTTFTIRIPLEQEIDSFDQCVESESGTS